MSAPEAGAQLAAAKPRAPALAWARQANQRRVLDPSGSIYHHWSLVVSLAFLYNFWSLSYRFAFREIDRSTVAFWFALDYSADLVYLLDVLVNFRTGYLEEGVLIRNTNRIRQHYCDCTRFYLDCLCLLPLDFLYLSFGFNSILRCTRLVKIYRFWAYVDRTERHTNYPNVFRTFTLVHYILVIFHWNACLFHMISKNKILDIENLYTINDNRCDDISCQYLHAFYWSTLALTTVGDLPRPRTKAEYLYVVVELFFGLFLFASVLGHVANIVTNVSTARKEFQAKLDAVKTFMRMRRVSEELQDKVIRWFDYLWISQKSSDEERSVACLPDRLKAEIAIHVHLETLRRVDIFQNTGAGFLCELVLRLKLVLFSPGDYVCRKNEVGHEMYIVSRGHLEVLTDNDSSVLATLKAGSYFGEISVLNVGLAGNKRTASVRSLGYSDLFCLNKQDLWDVLKNYPEAEARIRARAEERLSKLEIGGRPAAARAAAGASASAPTQAAADKRSQLSLAGVAGGPPHEPGPLSRLPALERASFSNYLSLPVALEHPSSAAEAAAPSGPAPRRLRPCYAARHQCYKHPVSGELTARACLAAARRARCHLSVWCGPQRVPVCPAVVADCGARLQPSDSNSPDSDGSRSSVQDSAEDSLLWASTRERGRSAPARKRLLSSSMSGATSGTLVRGCSRAATFRHASRCARDRSGPASVSGAAAAGCRHLGPPPDNQTPAVQLAGPAAGHLGTPSDRNRGHRYRQQPQPQQQLMAVPPSNACSMSQLGGLAPPDSPAKGGSVHVASPPSPPGASWSAESLVQPAAQADTSPPEV